MGIYVEIIKTKGYLIRKHDFDFGNFFKLHFPHKFDESQQLDNNDELINPDLLDNTICNSTIDPEFWIVFPVDKEILCDTKVLHGSVWSGASAIRLPSYCSPHNVDLTFMGDKETIFRDMLNKFAIYGEYIATVFF